MQKERVAQCSCGATKIILKGNPETVAICNCLGCQRRTGSAFGMSAYFNNQTIVSKTEQVGLHIRKSDGDRLVRSFFCKSCGTTVWWDADFLPNFTGTAVGCFGDPEFPKPLLSAWETTKHPWIRFSRLSLSFSKQPSDSFLRLMLALKLPRLAYLILSIASVFKKRNIAGRNHETCALMRIELANSSAK